MKQITLLLGTAVLLASCGTGKKLESANKQIAGLNGQIAEYSTQVNQLKTENIQYGKEAEDCRKLKENMSNKIDNLNKELAARGTSMKQIVTKLTTSMAKFENAGAEVTYKDGLVYVNFTDKFFFRSGSADISVRGRESLNSVAEVLRENPGVTLTIVGNTDSNPVAGIADNWTLSTERANAVVRILHDTYNINPIRLTASGRGKFNPIADNSTVEGREKNRRVELIFNTNMSRLWELMEQ